MYDQKTSKDLPKSTSSQESAAGLSPSALPDGPMKDLFGAVPTLANPSRVQENKKAARTSVTSGPSGSNSKESADLQSSMESRLRALFPTDGSIECSLTWKEKATPAGRRFCQLAPSARPIKEIDCGMWPTPSANCSTGAGTQGRNGGLNIQTAVALWPTPTAISPAKNGYNEAGNSCGLVKMKELAMWATPKASDPDGGRTTKTKGGGNTHLPIQVREISGMITTVSSAPTEKRGASPPLNPEFVFWLMGYPKEWVFSAQAGMQSCRKSRRGSSGQQCEGK